MNASRGNAESFAGAAPASLDEQSAASTLSGASFVRTSEIQRFFAVGFATLATVLGGCEQKVEPTSAPAKPVAPAVERAQSSAVLPQAPQTDILHYPIPVVCPAGSEFIPADNPAKLTSEQVAILNAAHYLWTLAVGNESASRDDVAKRVPIFPDLARFPAGHPVADACRAALMGTDSKAAYVSGGYMLEYPESGKKEWHPFKFFTFQNVDSKSSFFEIVGALGHEFQHAEQGKDEVSRPDDHRLLAEQFRRELDAYSRESQDYVLIARYLKTGAAIEPKLREVFLDTWLTDLNGQLCFSGFMSFRFKLQYYAAVTATSLEKVSQHLAASGKTSEAAATDKLRERLLPYLVMQRDVPIDGPHLHSTVSGARTLLEGVSELQNPPDSVVARSTQRFLGILADFDKVIEPTLEAERRFRQWQAHPMPFVE